MEIVRKIVRIILLLLFFQNVGGKFLNESYECNTMSNKHWNLIQWFYGKTDQICVTFIVDSSGKSQYLRLQDKILRELFQSRAHFRFTSGPEVSTAVIDIYFTSIKF